MTYYWIEVARCRECGREKMIVSQSDGDGLVLDWHEGCSGPWEGHGRAILPMDEEWGRAMGLLRERAARGDSMLAIEAAECLGAGVGIDTPARHWRWLLEDALYLLERGVRLIAEVEVPAEHEADAVREVESRGAVCSIEARGQDLAGEDVILLYVSMCPWVIEVVERLAVTPAQPITVRQAGALIGVLHGYSGAAIADWWRRTSEVGR